MTKEEVMMLVDDKFLEVRRDIEGQVLRMQAEGRSLEDSIKENGNKLENQMAAFMKEQE